MKILLQFCLGAFISSWAWAFEFGGGNDVAAVSGRASADYVRGRQADGSFTPENYVFAKGGMWSGAVKDLSIDKMTFLEVAHVIAHPLAEQNYLPGRDPKTTRLLIMVYWGTTRAPEGASDSMAYDRVFSASDVSKTAPTLLNIRTGLASSRLILSLNPQGGSSDGPDSALQAAAAIAELENQERDRTNRKNARMLGYDSWWEATAHFKDLGFGLDFDRQDMIDELERNRYFVVLMAYDFQLLQNRKLHKLLWETRFSIDQHHHEFDKDLPAMAKYASQFFGQDSKGLVHKEIPKGRVDIGELKSLGSIDEPTK
jgi:hypothetical protein